LLLHQHPKQSFELHARKNRAEIIQPFFSFLHRFSCKSTTATNNTDALILLYSLSTTSTSGTFTIGPNTSIEGVQGDRYVDQAIVEEDQHKNGWLSGAVIDAYLSLLSRDGENDDVYIVPTATSAAVRDGHAFATQHPVQFPCLMTVNNANSHWYVVYATANGRLFVYNSLPHVGGSSNGWGSGEENTLPQIQQWLRQKYVQQQRDANELTN